MATEQKRRTCPRCKTHIASDAEYVIHMMEEQTVLLMDVDESIVALQENMNMFFSYMHEDDVDVSTEAENAARLETERANEDAEPTSGEKEQNNKELNNTISDIVSDMLNAVTQ